MHFKHFATDIPYATKRYHFEAERHYGILDVRLGKHRYMLGDAYTLVDMALWGWSRAGARVLGEEAWGKLKNVQRHVAEISARPAAQRVEAACRRYRRRSRGPATRPTKPTIASPSRRACTASWSWEWRRGRAATPDGRKRPPGRVGCALQVLNWVRYFRRMGRKGPHGPA